MLQGGCKCAALGSCYNNAYTNDDDGDYDYDDDDNDEDYSDGKC